MQQFIFIFFLFFLLGKSSVFSQAKKENFAQVQDTLQSIDIDPLTPSKAAFYSAILPGLGQAYNKNYWKIPIVYGAIGTSMYFYIDSNKKYNQFRDEYKRRLEGYDRGEEYKRYDNETLIRVQKLYHRNRDFSTLFVVGFYVLNIIEANVNAHLRQFNVDERLSVKPEIYTNDVTSKPNLGLTVQYHF